MSIILKRNYNLYISKAPDATADSTNTVQILVKDFSFNQPANLDKVGRETLDPLQARTLEPHISARSPVTFSFTTYILPMADTIVTSPEEYLWTSLMGNDTIPGDSNATTSTIDFSKGNVGSLHELTLWFINPNNPDSAYRIDNAILDSAKINFDINNIAEIEWEGRALDMQIDSVPPVYSTAISLDGTVNTYVDMGDQAVLDVGTGDFTLEASFKGTANAFLVGKFNGIGYTTYLGADGRLEFLINDGTNFAKFTSTDPLWDDEWHTFSGSVDRTADTMTVVLDGVAQTPVNISIVTAVLDVAVPFRVGAGSSGATRWVGEIDEIRVWNTTRTIAQMQDYRLVEIIEPGLEATLIGYWKMNDGTGSVASDSSASGNDGTLTGNAVFVDANPLLRSSSDRTTERGYIKNRLSTISLELGGTTTYTVALTGGSIEIDNNTTFYNRTQIGKTTTPVGHYTGNREISGDLNFYLKQGVNLSADLYEALRANAANDTYETTHYANITINIGGTTLPYIQLNVPQAILNLPAINFEDALTIDVPFTAKEGTGTYSTITYNV